MSLISSANTAVSSIVRAYGKFASLVVTGTETHSGAEAYSGTETHSGAVTLGSTPGSTGNATTTAGDLIVAGHDVQSFVPVSSLPSTLGTYYRNVVFTGLPAGGQFNLSQGTSVRNGSRITLWNTSASYAITVYDATAGVILGTTQLGPGASMELMRYAGNWLVLRQDTPTN